MDLTVQTIVHDDLLHVIASGAFSLDGAMRTFGEIIDAIKANTSRRVLFDGRTIVGNPTVIERFYYGEFTAALVRELTADGFWPVPQFAYILKEPVLDPMRLGLIVANNRGVDAKVFEDPDEAMQWLGLTL